MTDSLLPQLVARLRHIQQTSGPVPSFLAKVISAPPGINIAPYVWVGYAGMGEMMWINLPEADHATADRLLAEGKYLKLTEETFTFPAYLSLDSVDLVVQKVALV